jgi:predicted nucleotidyltransferase
VPAEKGGEVVPLNFNRPTFAEFQRDRYCCLPGFRSDFENGNGMLPMDGVYQVNEIKEKLQPVFEDTPVYRAVLFGSYAKGLATERSDVDILVDGRGELRGLRFCGVLEDATVALGKTIDMIELSEIRPGSPILNEIAEQGVLLYIHEAKTQKKISGFGAGSLPTSTEIHNAEGIAACQSPLSRLQQSKASCMKQTPSGAV